MNILQKSAGIAAIVEAHIYIIAFIFYGAILEYPPTNASVTQELAFLSDNHLAFYIMDLIGYVLFGMLLVVLVLAVHKRLKKHTPNLSQIAAIFGFLWAALVITSGMISSVGLNEVIELGNENPEKAMMIWSTIAIITEGIGGGNEIVGGVWVLLLSIAALQGKNLPKPLIYLGILVGTTGILTTYPADIFTEIFGISQIIWFLWLGVYMLQNTSNSVRNNV